MSPNIGLAERVILACIGCLACGTPLVGGRVVRAVVASREEK